jgi:chromosome segregation ATPase
MIRFLTAVNLIGVLALAALCAAQWRTNGRLDSQVRTLEQTQQELTDDVARRDQRIKDDAADLDDFRRRVTLAETELLDQQNKLNAAIAQRDQLKAALQTWIAAVAQRDAALKKASDDIKSIAAQRDKVVAEFNDLAVKYNDVVKELNDARSKQ